MNISFVFPGFLIALAIIAVPVIIHLFNFRRFRKIMFTNVKFLKELKQETTSRSKLKHLLVLFSRILAVTFLVLAFAQPFIPASTGTRVVAERAVSIFIDNSFSMEAVTRDGTLLDIARKQARELASAFSASDQFQLLTCDFDPVHQRLVSREELLTMIDGIKVSSSSRKLSEIISRQSDALNQSGIAEKNAIIISDFQKSMSNIEDLDSDSTIKTFLIPVAAGEVANISVDSCWFSTPVIQLGQTAELNVRIRNSGQLDATAVPVRLSFNGIQKAVAATDVASGNYSDVVLTFTANTPGWQKALLSITDHPIAFDDQLYFSFKVDENSEILSLNRDQNSPYLKALFSDEGFFTLTDIDEKQIDYSSLTRYEVIFLNELRDVSSGLSTEIGKYVNNGGTLVIIPDSAINFESYSTFLRSLKINPFTGVIANRERVQKLTDEDPLFQGVFNNRSKSGEETDLPFADRYLIQSGNESLSGEVLMRLRSGSPFLSRYHPGKGQVYLFNVPFSGSMSNFSRHAIFVPVVYRIALSGGHLPPLFYTIGNDDRIELPAVSMTGEQVLHLVNKESGFDAIPGHRTAGTGTTVSINNQITQAGHYDLTKGDQTLTIPSFNFNRDESKMSFSDNDELTNRIGTLNLTNLSVMNGKSESLAVKFSELNEGTRLWKYCIMLALLFLAVEIMLLKFWKQ